jgi:hypothetical protein
MSQSRNDKGLPLFHRLEADGDAIRPLTKSAGGFETAFSTNR